MSTPTTPRPSEPVPVRPELNVEALTVALVDQSEDVRAFARDAADARLTEELNSEGGRFHRIVRNVWKGNIAREYYRQQYIREAEGSILQDQTLYANREDVDQNAATRARTTTILKFVGDYEDAIHTEAGEQRSDVTEAQANGEDSANLVTTSIRGLIRDYAEGRLDNDAFVEERNRLLNGLRQTAGAEQLFGDGLMMADNMLEVAQNVRAALAHGEGVDAVIEQIRVISGESRSGARTEAQYNRVDRVIDRINRTRAGSLLNEATVATAVSVVASLARVGSTKAAGAALKTALPGVGASVIAGLRESKQVKDERRQHAREMATGQDYDRGNARRRDAMQETMYETVSAQTLIEDLAVHTDPDQLVDADAGRFQEALNAVLDAQNRIELSDTRGIDLIGFSSIAEVESERLILDIALARAKVNLEHALAGADETIQNEVGINLDVDFSDTLNQLAEARRDFIETDISEKDAAFNALRRREIGRSAAKAALFGTSIGLVTQEIMAMASSSRSGLVEQIWHAKNNPVDGRHHDTLLHGIFGDRSGGTATEHHNFTGKTTEHLVGQGDRTPLTTSEELGLHHISGGKYELLDPAGNRAGVFEVGPDGALTPDSIHKLQEMGLTVNDHSKTITELIPVTRPGGVDEFLDRNGATRVTRDLWYDNNTPAPVFDRNELGLQWGGGSGVDAHGNYLFNVSSMTSDGSFHGNQSATWQQLAGEGKLKMAFSVSGNTQNQVFEVTIDAHGNAVIPAGSPAAQLFSVQNGHAVFEGKYAEVVQSMGVDPSGTEHIRALATHIGQDTAGTKPFNVTDLVPHTTTEPAFEILGTGYDTTHELSSFVEMAPTIPLYGRRALEGLIPRGEPMPPAYGGEGYGDVYSPSEQRRRWEDRRSPRLNRDPRAILDPREELNWYFDRLRAERGAEYVAELERRVTENENLRNVDTETRAIISIPVAAAHEADNIYDTLSRYAHQDPQALEATRILLSLNWIEGSDQDAVDRTIREVERAMADFPQLRVSYFTETWSRELVAERNGAIYGEVIGSLYNTAAAAAKVANDRGDRVDPVIVTNDADAKRVGGDYVARVVETAQNSPRSDVLLGKIHWGSEVFAKYPGYGIVSAFFMTLEDRIRSDGSSVSPASWGPNSAFRMSAYAAVGGVDTQTGAGADSELGRMIFAARSIDPGAVAATGYGGMIDMRAAGIPEDTTAVMRGAWVDSSPERLLGCYMKGIPLTSAWNNFNSGGYTPRPDLASGAAEDIEGNFDTVRSTVEEQFSGILSSGWSIAADPKVIEAALETIFPVNGSAPLWTIHRGAGGKTKFKFTVAGEAVLRETLRSFHDTVQEGLDELDRIFTRQEDLPTQGAFVDKSGKWRRANGEFMSKKEREAVEKNLLRMFGGLAIR